MKIQTKKNASFTQIKVKKGERERGKKERKKKNSTLMPSGLGW